MSEDKEINGYLPMCKITCEVTEEDIAGCELICLILVSFLGLRNCKLRQPYCRLRYLEDQDFTSYVL